MSTAEKIADAYCDHFRLREMPYPAPTRQQNEEFMRQYFPFSYEVKERIIGVLINNGFEYHSRDINCWWEANFAVSGTDDSRRDYAINRAVDELCTCVISHLEAAIANAENASSVDERLILLRDWWVESEGNTRQFETLLKERRAKLKQ